MNSPFPYVIIFLFTLCSTVFLTKLIIPFLKRRAEQPIYEDGPKWHMSKSGTPTMGGISFSIAITVALLIAALFLSLSGNSGGAVSLVICSIYALLNALIGVTDDLTKLRHRQNAGLTPRAKLILQFAVSGAFLIARIFFLNDGTDLEFNFGSIDLGVIYHFLSLLILVGITNFANLTDGIDGLATSVAFGICTTLFCLLYSSNSSVSFICIAIMGATVGFLIFNVHPARIFMGDTGSLFLGAIIASMAFELNNPLAAISYGGVYVIEGASVILQVGYFKLKKKRLFKMAPIHHHLEKCGWDENKICLCALVLTLLSSLTLVLYL